MELYWIVIIIIAILLLGDIAISVYNLTEVTGKEVVQNGALDVATDSREVFRADNGVHMVTDGWHYITRLGEKATFYFNSKAITHDYTVQLRWWNMHIEQNVPDAADPGSLYLYKYMPAEPLHGAGLAVGEERLFKLAANVQLQYPAGSVITGTLHDTSSHDMILRLVNGSDHSGLTDAKLYVEAKITGIHPRNVPGSTRITMAVTANIAYNKRSLKTANYIADDGVFYI